MARFGLSRSETWWMLRWSAVAVAISTLPYLLAVALTPPGATFLGLLPYAADGHTYLAKMLQGAHGELLYHLAFTPEPHSGELVFTFYLLLGRLTGALGLPMAIGLQAARVAFGFAMLVLAYIAVAHFAIHRAVRRVAFLLVAFSGGTGWIPFLLGGTTLLGAVPVDVNFPDSTTYWTLFTFPNYSVSVSLMLVMTLALLRSFRTWQVRWAIVAGLVGAALAATHPSVLVVYAVFAAYICFLWWSRRRLPVRESTLLAVTVALSAPVVAYEYGITVFNWAFRVWSEQNYCTSPSVLNMVASFGPPALVAAAGAVAVWRAGRGRDPARWHGDPERMVPVLWFAVVPVLMYIPTSVQRRLLEGWHIPLSLLIAVGLLRYVLPWLCRHLPGIRRVARGQATVLNSLLIVSTVSTMVITSVGLALVVKAARPLYLDAGETAAMTWLGHNSQPADVVLTGLELGNIIPGQTGNRVVLGHWSETLYAQEKAREIEAFFGGRGTDSERIALLGKYNVRFVWFGAEERGLGVLDPAATGYLRPEVSNGSVTLYRVTLP